MNIVLDIIKSTVGSLERLRFNFWLIMTFYYKVTDKLSSKKNVTLHFRMKRLSFRIRIKGYPYEIVFEIRKSRPDVL